MQNNEQIQKNYFIIIINLIHHFKVFLKLIKLKTD